jgi:predicted SprT family Zn-dependent metalloprotease
MFRYFNRSLFGGQLPEVFLNLSRSSPGVAGFFAPQRWESSDRTTHEISLNPKGLGGRPSKEVAATLVHEMVHLWQEEFGKPGRRGYHNIEWADKMQSVGLVPSNAGAPGGRRTGDQMSHYIQPAGAFELAFNAMPDECLLPWLAREGVVRTAPGTPATHTRNKFKFSCPGCGQNAWGKPSLHLLCGDCGLSLRREA